jgi:pyruvate dehydrogenase E2 component (dihydrolipoamide acetyltransferase)
MATIDVKIPDIGDFEDVPIIEVHVKPGDAVEREASLVTLESEKATFDVPSPAAGTVRKLEVKVGDRVKEGSLVVVLDAADGAADGAARQDGKQEARAERAPSAPAPSRSAPPAEAPARAEPPPPRAEAEAPRPRPPPPDAPAPVAASAAVLATPPPARRASRPRRRTLHPACVGSRASWASPSRAWRAPARAAASPTTTCSGS